AIAKIRKVAVDWNMENSNIGWTHSTQNFWLGCDKIVPECAKTWVCVGLAGPLVDKRRGAKRGDADDIAKIRAFAWTYLAGNESFTPDARSIPRVAASYLLHPERCPTKVRLKADEMIADCSPE